MARIANHQASRTLNSASRKVIAGEELYPMLGLVAAPEIAIAVPSEIRFLPPYPSLRR
jgi:hypothetical protein